MMRGEDAPGEDWVWLADDEHVCVPAHVIEGRKVRRPDGTRTVVSCGIDLVPMSQAPYFLAVSASFISAGLV